MSSVQARELSEAGRVEEDKKIFKQPFSFARTRCVWK